MVTASRGSLGAAIAAWPTRCPSSSPVVTQEQFAIAVGVVATLVTFVQVVPQVVRLVRIGRDRRHLARLGSGRHGHQHWMARVCDRGGVLDHDSRRRGCGHQLRRGAVAAVSQRRQSASRRALRAWSSAWDAWRSSSWRAGPSWARSWDCRTGCIWGPRWLRPGGRMHRWASHRSLGCSLAGKASCGASTACSLQRGRSWSTARPHSCFQHSFCCGCGSLATRSALSSRNHPDRAAVGPESGGNRASADAIGAQALAQRPQQKAESDQANDRLHRGPPCQGARDAHEGDDCLVAHWTADGEE